MAFPLGASGPVYAYDIVGAGPRKTIKMKKGAILAAMGDRFTEKRAPDELSTGIAKDWHWAWLGREYPALLHSGHWLAWCCRTWVKSPPPSLIKAMLDEKLAGFRKDTGEEKVPKQVVTEFKDMVTKEVTKKTAPAVVDDAVAFDTENARILLFTGSAKQRAELVKRVTALLQAIFDEPMLSLREWTLDDYLRLTRPHAALPSELDDRFMLWLLEHALNTHCAEVKLQKTDDHKTWVRVALRDRLKYEQHGGKLQVTGESVAERAMNSIVKHDNARIVSASLQLTIRSASADAIDRDFDIDIDAQGHITRCAIRESDSFKEAEIEAAMFNRAALFMSAAEAVRILFQAFDHGPLQEWMQAPPSPDMPPRQASLWPGAPIGSVVWHTDGEDTPFTSNVESETARDPRQGDLFDSPASAPDAPSDEDAGGAPTELDRDIATLLELGEIGTTMRAVNDAKKRLTEQRIRQQAESLTLHAGEITIAAARDEWLGMLARAEAKYGASGVNAFLVALDRQVSSAGQSGGGTMGESGVFDTAAAIVAERERAWKEIDGRLAGECRLQGLEWSAARDYVLTNRKAVVDVYMDAYVDLPSGDDERDIESAVQAVVEHLRSNGVAEATT